MPYWENLGARGSNWTGQWLYQANGEIRGGRQCCDSGAAWDGHPGASMLMDPWAYEVGCQKYIFVIHERAMSKQM
jgi:hypothetical protein